MSFRPRPATALGRGPGCAPTSPGRRPKAGSCPERSRRGRRLSAKQRGEVAELAFLHRAAALGLGVLKPLGDSLPYDVAVDNGRRLLRVQVKSASRPHRGVYEINAGRGRNVKRAYTSRDIDFLAACLFVDGTPHRRARRDRREHGKSGSSNPPITRSPDDPVLWFIFPLSAFSPRKTIRLSRRHTERWTPYREAWHLLMEDDLQSSAAKAGARIAARDTAEAVS